MPIKVRFTGAAEECILPLQLPDEEQFEIDLRSFLETGAPDFKCYEGEVHGIPYHIYIRLDAIAYAEIGKPPRTVTGADIMSAMKR